MAISEFAVSPASTNSWASVTTPVVGGSTKYGIYVTNANSPRYTFLNANFYPNTTSGSTVIVELYANAEGQGAGDPNTVSNVYDGVALTNVAGSSIPAYSLSSSSNTAIYGVGSSTKVANYVYNFSNNGYADTKKMAIGGNQKRRVFAIRSWGTLNANYNQPYIAFIGDSSALNYNGKTPGYSVGCVGATRTTSANTWVSHTAGDGTKYYSITNTTNNVNKYVSISLTVGHTYRFTLHAHTETRYDGVAICKTTNTTDFDFLTASDLISGSTSTGKCSGNDVTTTFEYAVGASKETRYIYFKSDDEDVGADDGRSFADVMVEDLGDLRSNQGTPTAADVNDISVFDVTAKTWWAPSGSSYNVTSGQEYIIYGYVAAVASDNPAEIVLKSTTFPSALTLVGRTVFLNEDGKQVLAEIEIPKFQFGNAFDFAMDAEGDASTFNFSGTALAAGDEKELIKIKTLKTGATGESVMDHAWDDVVIG